MKAPFDQIDPRDRQVLDYIRQVLEELFEDELGDLSLETDLKKDLHVDSTTAVEVAYRLSRLLDKEIPFERWYISQTDHDYTIRALAAFLRSHLED